VPAANHWETVVSCYEAAGLTEEDALLNARMARILTADLWNASTQRPVLWRPDLGALNNKKRNAEQQVQKQGQYLLRLCNLVICLRDEKRL